MKIRASVCLLVLPTMLFACNRPGPQVPAPAVNATLSFKALWWSQSQMENLNPNAPPPKTQVIELERWEYTDPIGVPHPDTVDLVASLSIPPGSSAVHLNARTTGRWKIGPQSDADKAVWDQT